ncbi:hypothetical protein SRHO_G00052870 [Serrasalmus rhombeus]
MCERERAVQYSKTDLEKIYSVKKRSEKTARWCDRVKKKRRNREGSLGRGQVVGVYQHMKEGAERVMRKDSGRSTVTLTEGEIEKRRILTKGRESADVSGTLMEKEF